jgi:hypothetical protein
MEGATSARGRFAFLSIYTVHLYVYDFPVKRTNINLREDQWTKLGKLSDITGATMSALIRKAIDAYLKKAMK